MPYSVIQENTSDQYSVKEKSSDLIVATFSTYGEARILCRGLNAGQGFNGYTPEFFVQRYESVTRA